MFLILKRIRGIKEYITNLEGYNMKMFETYAEACKDIEGKKGSFKVYQIPRDEQGRFTWERI